MGEKSKIEWCDATWNPTTGCTKVSVGCANCYIDRTPPMRMEGRKFEKGAIPIRLHPERLALPLRWQKPKRIFVNSMSDLFHDDVPDSFITAIFGVMAAAWKHQFLVLTKRAQRMRRWSEMIKEAGGLGVYIRSNKGRDSVRKHFGRVMKTRRENGVVTRANNDPWSQVFGSAAVNFGKAPLPNVWMGVSVESQLETERIDDLLETPAAVRFLSIEPMLGDIDLSDYFGTHYQDAGDGDALTGDVPYNHGIDWVIVGGESGPNAWPMRPNWVRSIRDQCQAAKVPFFFKQWGEWLPFDQCAAAGVKMPLVDAMNHAQSGAPFRAGKKAAGRMLDGREWSEFPDPLRVHPVHPC